MKKDKLSYVINFGLANFIKDELISLVQKSPWFVISYDESLNQKVQLTQMDLVVRYWGNETNMVKTRYFDSKYLGHAHSVDLLKSFFEALQSLNLNLMLQVAMDGPTVNFSFLQMVKKDRVDNSQNGLMDIGSCFIHSMHNGFKCGAESTDWKLKESLKGSSRIFTDSPARREDFISITDSNVFPFDFVGTRWIMDGPVAERLILVWPNVCKYIRSVEKTYTKAPSKRPKTKSYERVLAAYKDKMTTLKLEFFLLQQSLRVF